MSAYEMAVESWLGESETGEEFRKRLRKLRNFRRAVILQIFSTITQPLPNDAIPPPPVVVVQPERKDRGGQGGSREDEFATMPGAAVLQRVGRLAATVPREADAEAYAGALPMLRLLSSPGPHRRSSVPPRSWSEECPVRHEYCERIRPPEIWSGRCRESPTKPPNASAVGPAAAVPSRPVTVHASSPTPPWKY